jgi:FAD/FMN-containing dehydrogenase
LTELREPDPDLLKRLEAVLGPGGVAAPEPRFLEEPRGRLAGVAAAVLRPRDTAGVAAAVRLCAEARVGIVPYAGGTGLVGGQVSLAPLRPVVMSVERLSGIREVDPVDSVLTAGAGTILIDAQAAAEAAGRLFPLSLASEGSARIGGLLATNAGGIGVLRYGNARDLCLGLEAVMADGSVLNGLSHLRKDNTGYDIKGLLIGSEGTLGIITAASLRLFARPGETATAWVAVARPTAALDLLGRLRDALGETVSACEIMHAQGLAFLAETMPEVPLPLAGTPEWSVLIEAAGAPGIGERMEAALAEAFERDLVSDALVAQNEAQRAAFWRVRESIPEANRRIGAVASHDISVPPGRVGDFVERGRTAVGAIDSRLRVNCFGHLGDGNLHYNVFPAAGRARSDYDPVRARVVEAVHDLAHALDGSISAEHGIGRLKTADLARYGDPAKLAAMRAIKAALDPLGILNPGAVLPSDRTDFHP